MLAARVEEHGAAETLRIAEVPIPVPGTGEVRVEVRAAGLNHLDLWVRRGVPGHVFPLPLVLGSDASGVVAELGPGVKRAAVGDAVIIAPGLSCGVCDTCVSGNDPLCRDYGILGETRNGTCAEYVVVPEANLIPKPSAVDWADAGCFALAALTSWTMLVDRAGLRPAETLLVLAGGSGVGSLAVQIGRLLGCRVIATAGGPEKCARLPALGADATIDHRRERISERVAELTERRGVDVVFEHVGEATWEESLRCLARGGRLVTCGATTGAKAEIHLRRLFFKNLSIIGSTMGPRGHLHRLVQLLARGVLRPVVAGVRPLAELADAHRSLEERTVVGKLVVLPRAAATGDVGSAADAHRTRRKK
jgi:NADPH:quinone reductase-like Zn-dependent oxidoreductase